MTRRGENIEEHFFNSYDGTRIAYHVIGDGPPLLLANGLGGTYTAWRHLYGYFKRNFKIYSWDYRALYRSAPPDDPEHLRMEDHVKDALCLCEREGIPRAVWAGWSMGVQLCLEIYRHAPDLFRALILINGTYGNAFETAFAWKGSASVLPAGAKLAQRCALPISLAGRTVVKWKGFIKSMKKLGLVGTTLDEEVFNDLAREFSTLDVKNYMKIFRTLGEHSARDVLEKIQVPVLIIAGERDPFTPKDVQEDRGRRAVDRTRGNALYARGVPGARQPQDREIFQGKRHLRNAPDGARSMPADELAVVRAKRSKAGRKRQFWRGSNG
jgi:pimeloyl-ACP methyl ester carboxylesterase